MEGYFKISRHYKWAFGQVFDVMKYKAVIVMEGNSHTVCLQRVYGLLLGNSNGKPLAFLVIYLGNPYEVVCPLIRVLQDSRYADSVS